MSNDANQDIKVITTLCGFCQTPAITKCSRCTLVFYCNRECQKSHWKLHKKQCISVKDMEKEIKKRHAEVTEAPEEEEEQEEVLDTTDLPLKVEIRPSQLHGHGVFATARIEAGERICFYDGELKDARIKVRMEKLPNGHLKIKNPSEYIATIIDSGPDVDRCMAHPNPKWSGNVKLGNMDPSISGFGVGQFVNDSCRPDIDPIEMDFCHCSEALRKYQNDSLAKANCEISGNNFWIQSIRAIQPGEELLIHYGFQFWLRKVLLETESPDARFMLYALHDQSQQPFNLTRFFDYDDETCRIFLTDLIKIPENSIDNYKNVKELLFELTMKINRLDPSVIE